MEINVNQQVRRFGRVALDFRIIVSKKASIPTVYFNDRLNVGDLLNEYLIPKIAGRNIVKVRTSAFSHLRAIGSLVGSASNKSYIWGSGSIDGTIPPRLTSARRVSAVRGLETRRVIAAATGQKLDDLPMGDPALLMPCFFKPKVVQKEGIGIIPHFSDEAQVKDYLVKAGGTGVKLISVQQRPEEFISQMCACQAIYSSSLHGLILADSYGIPNKWISVSDRLLGGEFKFRDYYSTTISPDELVLTIRSLQDLLNEVIYSDRYCTIKSFTGDKDKLLSSFPARYIRSF